MGSGLAGVAAWVRRRNKAHRKGASAGAARTSTL